MGVSSAGIQLDLEHNRPFINLEFEAADGRVHSARTWVDSGGGGFHVSRSLADRIGLQTVGEPFTLEGHRYMRVAQPPAVRAGGVPLKFVHDRVLVVLDESFHGGLHPGAEAFLPGHVLMNHRVTFDYPGRRFRMAPVGESFDVEVGEARLPAAVRPQNGFARIEVEIAGERYGMLLDTGASYTMVSAALIERWHDEHPDWPLVQGALGPANMMARDAECSMMRLPLLRWGGYELRDVGVVSRGPGTFETWMSQMMTAPIVGALAGNVLRQFRLTIDYADECVYLRRFEQAGAGSGVGQGGAGKRQASVGSGHAGAGDREAGARDRETGTCDRETHHGGRQVGECEMVGLTLRQTARGCEIAAIQPYLAGQLAAGDRLLAVDGVDLAEAALPRIVLALRGRDGERRTLVVLRDGAQIEVQAEVRRII